MDDLVNPFCDRPALTRFVHDGLRSLVLNEQFPCLGGKSAVHQGAYRFGLYEELVIGAITPGDRPLRRPK